LKERSYADAENHNDAAAMIAGATSLAMAQSGPATGGEVALAGGANASINGMPPAGYKGPAGMPTYKGVSQ
jgi:hypothetical protein